MQRCTRYRIFFDKKHWAFSLLLGSQRSGFWFELLRGVTSGYPVSTFVNNTAHNNERDKLRMYPKDSPSLHCTIM